MPAVQRLRRGAGAPGGACRELKTGTAVRPEALQEVLSCRLPLPALAPRPTPWWLHVDREGGCGSDQRFWRRWCGLALLPSH